MSYFEQSDPARREKRFSLKKNCFVFINCFYNPHDVRVGGGGGRGSVASDWTLLDESDLHGAIGPVAADSSASTRPTGSRVTAATAGTHSTTATTFRCSAVHDVTKSAGRCERTVEATTAAATRGVEVGGDERLRGRTWVLDETVRSAVEWQVEASGLGAV